MPFFTWLVILAVALVAVYLVYARPDRVSRDDAPDSRRRVALDLPLDAAARPDHEVARELIPEPPEETQRQK
ncbi:MAG: autophagy-related protein 27 [Firmicutes bacterium]|nr:autophagy-related protein 27 [Bacillota bacterium]